MEEKLLKITRSPDPKKKYRALVRSKDKRLRNIDFGAKGYQQFADSTPLKKFARANHSDAQRRKRYFLRHSGVDNKTEALRREIRKSKGVYNAKILSHKFLW